MKILSSIFLGFILIANSYGNDWKILLDTELINWKQFEVELSDNEKEELLKSVYKIEMFNEFKDYEIVKKSNFHFVHLNNDTLIDIIYYGFAGTESDRTIFLENSGEDFKISVDLFGEIVTLEKDLITKSFKFYIINYPCCAGYTYHVEKYSYYYETKRVILNNKVAFIEKTEFPKERTINKKFETINEYYRLRSKPIVNNTSRDKYADHDGIGNIIAEFEKGTKGYAIAESVDDTGRIWWFVIISNLSTAKSSIFHSGDNNDSSYEFAGWMSSRFVKEL